MKRREFLAWTGLGAAGFLRAPRASGQDQKKPNILWITCEDMSPNLRCFGDDFAVTPHLDGLATEGVRYTQAFAHAPVCAPARSGIITGMYPCSLGSHHMRSKAVLPPQVRCFTEYLREAGYYCSNCSKEDYNFPKPDSAWDESSRRAHWRKRQPGQPFFSVINLTVTHESQIRLEDKAFFKRTASLTGDQRHDPANVSVPPFHPDTPEVRQDWARYQDLVTEMDRQAGQILKDLEEDGLAEDTIVFFYSDHGLGLPRGKRWLYDTGLHVPLIIRFPKAYQHLAPAAPGSAIDRLVSFVDFGPTVLSLLGVPVPEHLQGQPFLGDQARSPREYVIAGRDRMDERYDCTRAVRTRRFKYLRNFMPHLPYSQQLNYMYEMPTMQVWDRLAKAGKLEGPAALFMQPAKPIEELYDLEADPYEVRNLADAPEHQETLKAMRTTLHTWMREVRDLGLLPEAEMHRRAAGKAPYDLARKPGAYPLPDILATAELQRKGPEAVPELTRRLTAEDSAVRYWAVLGLMITKPHGQDALDACTQALADPCSPVRLAAADALCRAGQTDAAVPVLLDALHGSDEWLSLRAANILDNPNGTVYAGRGEWEPLVDLPKSYTARIALHVTR